MKRFILPFILSLPLLSGCSSLLYYPSGNKFVDVTKLKYKPKEVQIPLPMDKSTIVAWAFEPIETPIHQKPILVFFHGNGQNLSSHFLNLYWVLDHGYRMVIFDYPGYGGSSGAPSPKNTVEAGLETMAWVLKHYPDSPVVIYGQSLGGAVALTTWAQLEDRKRVCLVTLESSFLSYKSVARSVLRKQFWTWPLQPMTYLLLSDAYAPKSHLKTLPESSYLVLHGDKDPVVEFTQGEELFQALPQSKEFWKVPEGDHFGAFSGKDRLIWRSRFLERLRKDCT